MDGNRRYAKQRQLPTVKGHDVGSDKLLQVLHWCLFLGVQEVSVYAFSIDNFNRTPDEVTYLMDLAAAKFNKMADDEDNFLVNNRVKVTFWGDMSLVPPHVKAACDKLVSKTSTYTPAVRLNVLFAYSSNFEITRAKKLALAETGTYEHQDLKPWLFSCDSLPVDLIVRTSGETRLSDFMIWQISEKTLLAFLDVMWPDLTVFSLARAIVHFTSFKSHTS